MGFDQMHIRHCILYEFKKGSQKHPRQQEIFYLSIKGNFTLEDSLRSGRPGSVPLKVLKTVVEENPKQTSRESAKQFSTCHRTIITKLSKLGKVSKLSLPTSTELLSQFPGSLFGIFFNYSL